MGKPLNASIHFGCGATRKHDLVVLLLRGSQQVITSEKHIPRYNYLPLHVIIVWIVV
jgi:hypothetical protein